MILGMASNFDARLAEIVAAKPEWEPLAERLVISSVAGWRKPAPEFFAQMIAVAGQSAEHILYVGDDRRNDYEGARNAGMRAVLFSPESTNDDCQWIEKLSQLV
jgi:putative hydrolase of the HAD superfamily